MNDERDAPGPEPGPDGGDPVCWLDRLCPECAAMPTDDEPARCWRCGAPRPAGPRAAGDAPPPAGGEGARA